LNELSDADTTLADGYGHDADRAILLHAMLSAAGFKPEFVLGSPEPSIDSLRQMRHVSVPHEFQTVLVKFSGWGTRAITATTPTSTRGCGATYMTTMGITLADQTVGTIAAAHGAEKPAGRELSHDTRLLINREGQNGDSAREIRRWRTAKRTSSSRNCRPRREGANLSGSISQVAQGARPVGDLKTDFQRIIRRRAISSVEIDHL